jgi:hypothetical protein
MLRRRLQRILGRMKKRTYSIFVKRDVVFSTIAYGSDTPVTSVSWKPHWTEDVLVGAGVENKRVDGKRGSRLADVSIGETDGREIQGLWPGNIGGNGSRSPDIRGLLPVRRRQGVEEGRKRGLLVSRLHDEGEKTGGER